MFRYISSLVKNPLISRSSFATFNRTCSNNAILPGSAVKSVGIYNEQYDQTQPKANLLASTSVTGNLWRPSMQYGIILDYTKGILEELWDGFLLAVPKKRRSLAVRRRRMRARRLKPRDDIEKCLVCGAKKLAGHLCKNCFDWTMKLTEEVWEEQRKLGKLVEERHVRSVTKKL